MLRRCALWLVAILCLTSLAQAQIVAPSKVDRTTPRRAVEAALQAAATGNTAALVDAMDLRDIPLAKRAEQGTLLATDLAHTLTKISIEPKSLSDDPDGDPLDGAGVDVVAYAPVGSDVIMISVARSNNQWLFSRATVALLPMLREAAIDPVWTRHLPAPLREPFALGLAGYAWAGILTAFTLGAVVSLMAARLLRRISLRIVGASTERLARPVVGLGLTLGAIVTKALLYPLELRGAAELVCAHLTTTALILGLATFLMRLVRDGTESMASRLPEDTAGELQARSVRTQLVMTRRLATLLIGFVAIALVLVQFKIVRTVGMSLLASAGLAGIVLGFAAQRSLSALIAGVQISLTQPIRIGDLVVMESETGVVEEITLTFVVLKLLDDRRLVVPIARVLEQPFQNWTRQATRLTISFRIHVGPRVSVAAVRAEVLRLAEAHPLWDKRSASLSVDNLTERSLVLSVSLSVARPEHGFVLRNDVREGLVIFLQGLEEGRHLLVWQDG